MAPALWVGVCSLSEGEFVGGHLFDGLLNLLVVYMQGLLRNGMISRRSRLLFSHSKTDACCIMKVETCIFAMSLKRNQFLNALLWTDHAITIRSASSGCFRVCDATADSSDRIPYTSEGFGSGYEDPFDVFEENGGNRRAPPLVRVEKMCLLPESTNCDIYGPWKKNCLADFEILGGLNSKLPVEHTPSIPLISKVPTKIVGMDVSHGSPCHLMCHLLMRFSVEGVGL